MMVWPRRVMEEASRVSKKTAGGRAKHTIKSVHDDFYRLGQRRVMVAFCALTALAELVDDSRQAVMLARKALPAKPASVSGPSPAASPSINPTGSIKNVRMNGGIKAFVVQHQE